MDFRTRRQLAVLAVTAVAALGLAFLAVRGVLPEPSCTDGRKNQGEEEADCGGPCLSCLLKNPRPLETFWVRHVSSRPGVFDIAAELSNPNAKLSASAGYELKLFDTAGVAVGLSRGRATLAPGQTLHLTAIGLASGRIIRGASLVLGDVRWEVASQGAPDLIAANREYVIERDGQREISAVKAVVQNRTHFDFSQVVVSAIVLDPNGNLLGVHRTVIPDLAAGASQPVRFTWPEAFARPVSTLIIEARPTFESPEP